MKRCPVCKSKINGVFLNCPVCGAQIMTKTDFEKAKSLRPEMSKQERDSLEKYVSEHSYRHNNVKKKILIAAACLGGAGVVAGSTYGITRTIINATANQQVHTIKFVGANGEELQKEEVKHGQEIEYKGSIPQKDLGDGKNYVFTGWNPELKAGDKAKENVTYTAKFEEVSQDKYINVELDSSKPGCASVYWNQNGYQPKYLVIPEFITVDGKRYVVDSIKRPSSSGNKEDVGGFENCTSLISVELPESITSIDSNAFKGCTNLKSVKLHNYLDNISTGAFKNCEMLSSITLPDSLKTICESAFENCFSLSSIIIPENVTKIEPNAFGVGSCITTGLKNVEFKGDTTGTDAYWRIGNDDETGLPYIPFSTSENANNLKSNYSNLTWHKKYESIRSSALKFTLNEDNVSYKVSSYKNPTISIDDVVIPSYHYDTETGETYPVTTIETEAFINQNITSVTLPETVTTIERDSFKNCRKLQSINLENVTKIGKSAFENTPKLTTINKTENSNKLNDEIKEIPETAFYRSGITSIELPYNCVSIGKSAFEACLNLTNIVFNEKLEELSTYAFAGDPVEELNIPGNVGKIGVSAFINCTKLKEVILNEGTQVISEGAFNNCSSLTSIKFPSTIDSIYGSSFAGSNLKAESIVFANPEEKFQTIDSGALKEIVIKTGSDLALEPNNFTKLGLHICRDVFNVTIHSDTVVSYDLSLCAKDTGEIWLNHDYHIAEGASPISSIMIPSTYITRSDQDVYKINESKTFTGYYASDYTLLRRSLTSITISPNIVQLGSDSLFNCVSLTNIKIPRSVKHIQVRALGHDISNAKLTHLYIPSSVTHFSPFENVGRGGEPYANLNGIYFENTEAKWSMFEIEGFKPLPIKYSFTEDYLANLNLLVSLTYDPYFYLQSDLASSTLKEEYYELGEDAYMQTESSYCYYRDIFTIRIDCSKLKGRGKNNLYFYGSPITGFWFQFVSCYYSNTEGEVFDLIDSVYELGDFGEYCFIVSDFFSTIAAAVGEEDLQGKLIFTVQNQFIAPEYAPGQDLRSLYCSTLDIE